MTTPDTTALQERIETALLRATDNGADRTEEYAAAVLPIIAAEVRKAQAEALREEAVRISLLADEYRHIEFADRDAGFYAGVRVALQREVGSVRTRADQIETGDQA